MDPVIPAAMVFTVVILALVSGTILLFPVTRRLGAALEQYLAAGNDQQRRLRDERVMDELQALRSEVQALGERQDFVERLLEAPKTRPDLDGGEG